MSKNYGYNVIPNWGHRYCGQYFKKNCEDHIELIGTPLDMFILFVVFLICNASLNFL